MVCWVLLILVAIVGLYILNCHIRRLKDLSDIAANFGGRVLFFAKAEIPFQGQNFILKHSFTSGSDLYKHFFFRSSFRSRVNLSRLLIKSHQSSIIPLIIKRQGRYHEFFKSIGFVKEATVSDSQFNEYVYFEGEDQQFISKLFEQSQVRQATLNLLVHFTSIEFTPQGSYLRKVPCRSLEDYTPAILNGVLKDFLVLLKALPNNPSWDGVARQKIVDTNKNLMKWSVAALWITGLVFICFALSFPIVDAWPSIKTSFIVGLSVSVAVLILAFKRFKGYSYNTISILWIVLLLSAGIIVNLMAGLIIINATLDSSDSVSHESFVIDKYIRHRKGSRRDHYIVLEDQSKNFRYTFVVKSGEYANITPHQTKYHTVVKQGVFNWPWVVQNKRIIDGNSNDSVDQ